MGDQIYVRAIEKLRELESKLRQFSGKAEEVLIAVEREIQRTFEWLEERLSYWCWEVRRREEEVEAARVALENCRRSDESDCGEEEEELRIARTALLNAEEELTNARRWRAHVEQATTEYKLQAYKLQHLINTRITQTSTFLQNRYADLANYIAIRSLERTDPYWREADKRADPNIAQKEFEKGGDWRREFSSDAGKEEHKKWKEEIIERETRAGRIRGVDYDLEPALTHPDGGMVYPDYVDYKKDIIIDRKPIGEGESKESVAEKYSEQRQRHIDAYEHSTGRKVLYYEYSFYPSPKDIF